MDNSLMTLSEIGRIVFNKLFGIKLAHQASMGVRSQASLISKEIQESLKDLWNNYTKIKDIKDIVELAQKINSFKNNKYKNGVAQIDILTQCVKTGDFKDILQIVSDTNKDNPNFTSEMQKLSGTNTSLKTQEDINNLLAITILEINGYRISDDIVDYIEQQTNIKLRNTTYGYSDKFNTLKQSFDEYNKGRKSLPKLEQEALLTDVSQKVTDIVYNIKEIDKSILTNPQTDYEKIVQYQYLLMNERDNSNKLLQELLLNVAPEIKNGAVSSVNMVLAKLLGAEYPNIARMMQDTKSNSIDDIFEKYNIPKVMNEERVEELEQEKLVDEKTKKANDLQRKHNNKIIRSEQRAKKLESIIRQQELEIEQTTAELNKILQELKQNNRSSSELVEESDKCREVAIKLLNECDSRDISATIKTIDSSRTYLKRAENLLKISAMISGKEKEANNLIKQTNQIEKEKATSEKRAKQLRNNIKNQKAL